MSGATFSIAGRICYAKDDPPRPGKPWASIRVCIEVPGAPTPFGVLEAHKVFLSLKYDAEDQEKPYFQVVRNRLAPDVHVAIWGSIKVREGKDGQPRLYLDAPWRNVIISAGAVQSINRVEVTGRYHADLASGFVVKTSTRNPKTKEWKDSFFPVAYKDKMTKRNGDATIAVGSVYGVMPGSKDDNTWILANWAM